MPFDMNRIRVGDRVTIYPRGAKKTGVGTGIDALRANVELQNETQRLINAQTQLEDHVVRPRAPAEFQA